MSTTPNEIFFRKIPFFFNVRSVFGKKLFVVCTHAQNFFTHPLPPTLFLWEGSLIALIHAYLRINVHVSLSIEMIYPDLYTRCSIFVRNTLAKSSAASILDLRVVMNTAQRSCTLANSQHRCCPPAPHLKVWTVCAFVDFLEMASLSDAQLDSPDSVEARGDDFIVGDKFGGAN